MRSQMMRGLVVGWLAAVACLPSFAKATAYKIDPQHSSAQFAVTHLRSVPKRSMRYAKQRLTHPTLCRYDIAALAAD